MADPDDNKQVTISYGEFRDTFIETLAELHNKLPIGINPILATFLGVAVARKLFKLDDEEEGNPEDVVEDDTLEIEPRPEKPKAEKPKAEEEPDDKPEDKPDKEE